MKFLQGTGANLNVAIEDGQTPVHKAAQSGYLKIAEFLVACGAKVGVPAKNGVTPVHLAA